jgi:hypothetical protein
MIFDHPVSPFEVLWLPTSLITTLAIIGMFTPFSNENVRQERLSLGLTTMLSMSVFVLLRGYETELHTSLVNIS